MKTSFWGIGVLCGTLFVGGWGGLAPAILVLLGATLVGAIALFSLSLRAMESTSSLPPFLQDAHDPFAAMEEISERKQNLLRMLQDLTHEHAVGKLSQEEYEALSASPRRQAREELRALDTKLAPFLPQAEALVEEWLATHPLSPQETSDA